MSTRCSAIILKMISGRLEDVQPTSCRRSSDVLQTFTGRLEDVQPTSCRRSRDVLKTFNGRLEDVRRSSLRRPSYCSATPNRSRISFEIRCLISKRHILTTAGILCAPEVQAAAWVPGTGHWPLATGHWALGTGHWALGGYRQRKRARNPVHAMRSVSPSGR
jgi:hypothetical protein